MSLLAAGIATGAASLLGQGIGAYSAGRMNKRGERFARSMYDKQRQHAVDDWHMMNAYNDPSAQMQRLRDAGLNPNLVYGSGADATTSSTPRSAQSSQPKYETPKLDLGSVVMQGMQMKQLQANIARTEAETNRIQADTDAMLYQNRMLTPNMFAVEYENRYSKAFYGADKEHSSATIQRLEAETKKLISGYMKDDDLFQNVSNRGSGVNQVYEKIKQSVANMVKQHEGQELVNKLKEYEVDVIQTLGVNQSAAAQILSSILKLFLLRR